jgi:hypothetical protein
MKQRWWITLGGCGGVSPSRRWRELKWRSKIMCGRREPIRGKTCLVGKLIADHLVSKEIIRATLLRGWKPSGTPLIGFLRVLESSLCLVPTLGLVTKLISFYRLFSCKLLIFLIIRISIFSLISPL